MEANPRWVARDKKGPWSGYYPNGTFWVFVKFMTIEFFSSINHDLYYSWNNSFNIPSWIVARVIYQHCWCSSASGCNSYYTIRSCCTRLCKSLSRQELIRLFAFWSSDSTNCNTRLSKINDHSIMFFINTIITQGFIHRKYSKWIWNQSACLPPLWN